MLKISKESFESTHQSDSILILQEAKQSIIRLMNVLHYEKCLLCLISLL